ncbi:MAG: enoyl-CoA hydratase-related protein [Dehalococcoidales bacterium]|nr:enoyl-CoA hydratase-related protein [Dehalococcoidales bacterium]
MAARSRKEPFEPRLAGWYEKPMDYRLIIYEADPKTHIAKITLNRPEVMNAMNHQLRAEFFHALKFAERDDKINVIIIKGAGRCFSAGYDLSSANVAIKHSDEEPDLGSRYVDTCEVTHWARYVVQQWWQIWELSKVTIAQAHGYCLAGGSELAAMCDLLVTTPDCQFGYPPMRAMGVDMVWFPWLLPMRKAHELAFTGDTITGEDAYRFGMANYCVPVEKIDAFTEKFAERIAMMPWQMTTQYKRAIKKAYEIMGMRTALETGAMFAYHRTNESEHAKEWDKLFQKLPLKEYLNLRDQPYKDNLTARQDILSGKKPRGRPKKKM